MIRRPIRALLALAIGALCSSSCASVDREVADAQPFHVAVIPMSEATRLPDPDGSEGSEIALALDTAVVGRAVQDAIDGTCFARASLLAPPDDVPAEEFAAWDVARRDAYWLARAQEVDADLVLECDLAFATKVAGTKNEKFWLNLPLFLLGGPACYFVGDRTYRGEARLRASLYELHAIADERATFSDARSRLVQVESRFRDESLDFIDRADGVGQYAASLVVPAGLLARDGEGVEENLTELVGRSLADGLARELALQRREVSAADRVAPFRLEPDVRVGAAGDVIEVRASVLLEQGDVDRMDDFVVRSGPAAVRGEFGEGVLDADLSTRRERVLRYELSARLPRSSAGPYLNVAIAGGGRARVVRSFTIPLDEELRRVDDAVADARGTR